LPGAPVASLWAGQGVGLVRNVQPAATIVMEIVEEARAVLRAGALLAEKDGRPEVRRRPTA
jgi:NAD(P)H-dependent flavin oxidoreductase YrpB (nitropropane dioxygenase family)